MATAVTFKSPNGSGTQVGGALNLTTGASSGTDQAGAALTLNGGQGTGTGTGGSIVFKVADGAGSTGSSANALATALTIADDKSALFAGAVRVTGTLTLGGTAIAATANELNIIDGDALGELGVTLVDADQMIVNDDGTMKQVTVSTMKTYVNTAPQITTRIEPASADGATLGSAAKEWSDLYLADSSVIYFGNDQDVTLTHVADTGLKLKNTSTTGNSGVGCVLTLQTGDTDIASGNVLGQIDFQAPDEGTGTDAELVAAGIAAVSEGDFSASNNATKLSFKTAASAAASETMSLSSAGNLTVTGTIACATSLTIGSAAMVEADLEKLDDITNGTAAASKALVLDASKNIATIGTIGCGAITSTGSSSMVQLTTSGRVIVDDTTDATSTTDGSLQTDGGLSVVKDAILGNDLKLLSDSAVLSLGAGSDATLTHDGTTGLTIAATPVSITSTGTFSLNSSTGDIKFKNTSTSGNSGAGCVLTLQTGDTDIASGNVLGQIDFQAPDEGTGTDAILVAAGIAAVSEGDFSASNNATKLSFKTASSEAASEKMSLSSTGMLGGLYGLQVPGAYGILSVAGIKSGDSGTNGKFQIMASNGNTNCITVPNNVAAAEYTLPAGGPTNNYVLKTDSNGVLSWTAQSGGGGGGVSAIDDLTDAKKGGVISGPNNAAFDGSLLLGRTNTGTLTTNSINNIGIGFSDSSATVGPLSALTSGAGNVAIGAGTCATALTSGNRNSILGASAAAVLTSGTENTIIGNGAGSALTTGSSNVIIGGQTGTSLAGHANAVKNVLIGHRAGVSVERGSNTIIGGGVPGNTLTTGVNNMCIGFGADVSSATVNNEITLGNGSVTELRCADTSITSLSDARDKTDVIDLPWGLDFVDSLRPVQFTWDRRVLTPEDENWAMNGKKRTGFLAQELQTAMTDNANDVLDLVYESNPDRLEVKMGKLVPMLTQAIKELKAEVDTLKAEVAALKNA